ncbi:PKD domain-containing protein [Vibrio vulnificus]|nr:PKD domain-containing protein [Vibrio vulnificus]MCU8429150.1 PKD domain-containing protein [Vibrio vulnificus]
MKKRTMLLLGFVAVFSIGCDNNTTTQEEILPIANAGHPISSGRGTTVVLNGSQSHDPDEKSLTYQWTIIEKPSGSLSTLSDNTSPFPSLYLDKVGIYKAQLIVSNGEKESQPSIVTISDADTPPVANAGKDIKLSDLGFVVLDGTGSFDSDGDKLEYRWTLLKKPQGSSASILQPASATPTLNYDSSGEYIAELVVSDGVYQSTPDRVVLTDSNIAPIAKPKAAAFMTLGQAVALSGSESFDADGDTLSYQWHMVARPNGSQANLLDATTPQTSITPDVAGDYIVALVVKDGNNASSPATVTIHAASSLNQAPIAVTGHDRQITTSQEVHLDGSASHDPEGNSLTYRWSLVHKPSGSLAQLSEPFSVHPFFTPDIPGSYVAQLIVNDGTRDSLPTSVLLSDSNLPPVAHAGGDLKGTPGQTVQLDGSSSTDGNGDPLSYRWHIVSQPSGSQAVLANSTAAQPSFTLDVQGHYVVQLVVNDGYADSAPDNVVITDVNLAPIADAGNDQKISKGSTVKLSGSRSTDPEGLPLSYHWTLLSQPAGSAALLSATDTITTDFVADVGGDYIVQLVVNDGELDSTPATVIVRDFDKNTLPVASAGTDLAAEAGQSILLDGSASFDADGDSLSYQWALLTRPTGSAAQLTDAVSANPTLKTDVVGDYVVQLVVSDGKGNSLPDTVLIHDIAKNVAPVADAGNDRQVDLGTLVALSGQASFDTNGDTLSYRWALISKPAGSAATLANANQASSQFTLDIAGSYVAQLIVNDGKLDSSPVTVSISNKPSTGIGANPVPSGHTLILSSSLGGDEQVGGLYSISEKNLNEIHPLMSLKGKPGVQTTDYLGLVFSPERGKFFFMLPNEGLYGGATVMSFDPATKAVEVLRHIEYEVVNGNRVYGFASRLLIHPSGKALFGLAKYGSLLNAGRVFYLNIDPASPDYLTFTWIADLGTPDVLGDTFGRGPLAHMQWNGDNRIFIANQSKVNATKTNVFELTPSNSADLSQPWVPSPFLNSRYINSFIYSYSGNYISASGDSFVSANNFDGKTIFDVSTREGGGSGTVNFDCRRSLGVFSWLGRNRYSVCRGDSSRTPLLTEVNTVNGGSSDVRRFSGWGGAIATGFAPSSTGGALYIANGDDAASAFADGVRSSGSNVIAGFTIKPSQIRSVGGLNYADSAFIVGGSDRGYIFVGDPGIADFPNDNINDRYVSILSYDGGATRNGAIVTKDRLDDSVTVTSLGYAAGAYPIGKPLVHSSGNIISSVWFAPGFEGWGATFRYDPNNALIHYGTGNQSVRPGIALKEDSQGQLIGLGTDTNDAFRQVLYSIDPDTLTYSAIASFDSTGQAEATTEVAVKDSQAWVISDSNLYCFDLLTKARANTGSFTSNGAHSPVRALTYSAASSLWYLPTAASGVSGQGTIQQITDDCSAPIRTDAVTGLVDIPSTALLAASDGKLYYGTENGKLMQFDPTLNQVQQFAALGVGKVVGYLTEDSNGDILGILRLDGSDVLFAAPLAGGTVTSKALPSSSPVDAYYPGVVELK